MDITIFMDRITEITDISREEIFKLIQKEQEKVIGTLHEKVALMHAVIKLYHQSHDKELFEEIKRYMTLFDEDICFSENLDINTVKWYICEHDNLELSWHEFGGGGSNLQLYECDCSKFSKDRTCSHIEIYKDMGFDPWTIYDNFDCYLHYQDIRLEDVSFETLITKFPRWIIDYLIKRWQKNYSLNQIRDKLGVSNNTFNKLFVILLQYKRKLIKDLEDKIKERFLNPKDGKVSVSGLNLEDLPSIPVNLPYIEILDLSANNLASLPHSLNLLTSLKELNLQTNYFTEMPVLIGNLITLETLKLNYNKIKRIPRCISNLQQLKILELEHNNLTTLPDSFGNLLRLESLKINYNRLEALPDTIGNLEALKYLNLSNNNLITLPDTFYNLKSLKELDLSNNKGLYIPTSINKLKSLRILSLHGNGYDFFPESICSLKKLEVLSLTSNRLKTVPDCIGNLTSLKYLNLGNMIENYPESLCKLKNLEHLSLGAYSYSILPDFLIDFLIELEANGADLGIAPIFFDELKQRRA